MVLAGLNPASAAARLVVSTPEPMQVFVDGMLEPTSMGSLRVAISHIEPGRHMIALHSLTGQLIHSETVLVPVDADVRVQFVPGLPFQITGGSAVSGAAPPPPEPGTPLPVETGAFPVERPESSQTASGPRSASTGEVMTGAALSTSRASGLANVMKNPTPTNLVIGTARGVKSMTTGAQAGTNFGAAPPAARKIKRPNVIYGKTIFSKASGGPLVVYENGMLVAELGEGEAFVTVELEVGRRELEIRSGVDFSVLFQGDLQVDQRHVEQVLLSDVTPPRATIKPWVWKGI